MDAVIGPGIELLVRARIGQVGGELAAGPGAERRGLDIGDAKRLHARDVEGVHRADIGVELRLAHLRQADPIDLDAALAEQVDDRGHPLGHDPLPALAHIGVAVPIQVDALGVVRAIGDDRDVDRIGGQFGAEIVEQVQAAIAGEAGRPLGELLHLIMAVAAQDIVEPRPDAIAETVAEHANPDRPPFAHSGGKLRRETVRHGRRRRIGRRRRTDRGRRRQHRFGIAAAGRARPVGKEGNADDGADHDADEQHRGPIQRKKQFVHGYPGPHPLRATPNPGGFSLNPA